MKYKLNLHAHTIFSDGYNTPYLMALKAKELGFTALVITDHYYGRKEDTGLSKLKYRLLKKACIEAEEILPIITGIEYSIGKEEVLIFGSDFIKQIFNWGVYDGKPPIFLLSEWKEMYNGACILAHPHLPKNWRNLKPILDGFEEYSSGCNMFENVNNKRSFDCLKGLQRWCNSDAHGSEHRVLSDAYSIIDSKVETEEDLIKYIKSGKQPEHYINGIDEKNTLLKKEIKLMSTIEKNTTLFIESVGETLEGVLNPDKNNRKYGYMVLVFPFGDCGVANYISNARREDMIETLREKADVLEKGLDIVTDDKEQ